ncbi:MAG: DVU0298 family protein [Desulfobaccales bacterium]
MRQEIKALLEQGDFAGLVALAAKESLVAGILMQYLYDPHDPLHWRALEGLGHVARGHPQEVKKIITRLLWLLNEDSGSFGWGAAAALGEIGRHELSVVADIIPMFCGFLEEPFSRSSMLWGIGRLAEMHPGELDEVRPFMLPCLEDVDPQVRALAAWALGKLKEPRAREGLEKLLEDDSPVTLYDAGELRRTTVAGLAREALAALH